MLGTFRPGVKSAGTTKPQYYLRPGLGSTTVDANVFENPTPANAQTTAQVSPATRWRGRAWHTTSLVSQTVDFRAFVQPASATNPYGVWKLQHSVNGAAFADLLTVDGYINGGRGVTITPPIGLSNGSPGTTRHMTFENTGSYTWTEYRFNSTLKSAIGANSSGGLSMYASGGNVFDYYQCSSGLGSCSLISYNISTGFVHYQDGRFGGKVGAGSTSAPTSTLQSNGSTALKVKRITASQALDDTATHWLCDATNAAACTGTASVACSTYLTEGDCTARSSHGGGCSWNPGTSCSVFNNEYGMGACQGQSPCVAETSSCVGPDNQSSCESQDDSWGGSCAWNQTGDCTLIMDEGACNALNARGCTTNLFDCTTLNYNEAGCTGHSGCSVATANSCSAYTTTAACSGDGHCTPVVDGDCTALSDGGGDGTNCATQPECSYDSGTGACTGLYFTSCTGDNSTCTGTPFNDCSGSYYQCEGNYYTGNCTGTYGTACTGTPSCSGITNSTDCGNEAGCGWNSVLLATLPSMTAYPDRTYFISNDSAGGADVRIVPPTTTYPATTVNGEAYWDLPEYRDGIHLTPYATQVGCDTAADQSACTALVPYGCSVSLSYCSYNTMDNLCTGNAVCPAHDGNQSACEAQQYYSGCIGNYYSIKEWRIYTDTKKKAVTYSSITADNELMRADGTTGTIQGSGIIASDTGIITTYGGVATNGKGFPAIYKVGRSTSQTAAVASVAAYTNGAADGTFEVSANVRVVTATTHNFTVEVTYTDEGNTARTMTLAFIVLAGTVTTAIANAAGAVPYAGIPVHIRVKASTAITIKTTGTFTTVNYNVEGVIKQIA